MTISEVLAHQARVKPSKYRAQASVDHEGRRHASKAEARRWAALQVLERSGEITALAHQPKFELKVNGVKLGHYIADAAYMRDGLYVVEDTKSKPTMTSIYRLKKKLMKALHNIEITENMT